ncbi:hypothetical protein ACH54D_20305 [Atlantibacter hermannii]|nr:hypothetical protein [Atlantibacter hermannii]
MLKLNPGISWPGKTENEWRNGQKLPARIIWLIWHGKYHQCP